MIKIFVDVQNTGVYSGMPTIFIKFIDNCDSLQSDVDEILKIGRNELGLKLEEGISSIDNWRHHQTFMPAQICFFGDDVLLYQKEISNILKELEQRCLTPILVTIETKVIDKLDHLDAIIYANHIHMNCLLDIRNEINYEILSDYINYADSGSIVINHAGTKRSWEKIEKYIDKLKDLVYNKQWKLYTTSENFVLKKYTKLALKKGFFISHKNS